MNSTNNTQDKSIRLLNYLAEITRLRSTSIKDIQAYNKILWLNEIPLNSKGCFTRAWGTSDDFDSDIWIEIQKYDEPVLEDVPIVCEDWVDHTKLYNSDTIPELLKSIVSQFEVENPDWTPDLPQEEKIIKVNRTLNLENHPDVSKEWEGFIKEKWIPWSELHKKWNIVQTVYSKLFAVHQDQLKLGEEYELVLGLGFLTWQTKLGNLVRRHLLMANANLNFEARIGKFTINPALDGAKLSLEFDMLEVEEQPAFKIRKEISDSLIAADDDPWDKSTINPVLKALANCFAEGQGEYHCQNLEITKDHDTTKPIVSLAPAIILRKRNTKSLQQVIEKITEQIKNGIKIPDEFLDLSEGISRKDLLTSEEVIDIDENNIKSIHDDGLIYFPLHSNEKQNEIVEKYRQTSGVLVQGPPGTGKSHTIANLICHLLASGQRVLVTAKTPRALKVLQDKIPDQLKPLCINLLGSGIDEQNSLEVSVSNILSKQDQRNDKGDEKKIEKRKSEIYNLKKEKASIDNSIRSIRESESLVHSILEGKYSGTAAKIALRIRNEEKLYEWFSDIIPYELECKFSIQDLLKYREKVKDLAQDKKEEFRLKLPISYKDYPDLETLQYLIAEEKQLLNKTMNRDEILKTNQGQCLNRVNDIQLTENLIKNILNLIASVDSVSKRPLPWVKEAVYDMLSDKDTPWKDLLKVFDNQLNGLKDRAFKLENISFNISFITETNSLLSDAKELKKYLEGGGRLGFGIFASNIPRRTRYIHEKIFVDSKKCNNVGDLEKLIASLEIRKTIDYCWSLWSGKVNRSEGPLFLQVGELEELREALVNIVKLYDILESVKIAVGQIPGLGEVAWYDRKEVLNLLNIAQIYVSIFGLEKVQGEIEECISKIGIFKSNEVHPHPLIDIMSEAISQRDFAKYSSILGKVEQLRKEIEVFDQINEIISHLSNMAPVFTKLLVSNQDNKIVEKYIYQFEHAWNWSRVKSWLVGLLKKDDLPSLEKRSIHIDYEIKENLAELASLLAWKFCFSRMGDSHRRHLTGWQQAIKKIGKGTGKHAYKHKRDAQMHLNECREAVPCWIMPLHRLYESVDPRPEIFDVIIVDEASQCGPEALPLMFLSTKIIIVGDDQQISPDVVGVSADKIHTLMEEYLYDFVHADSFAPDSSLFDHAKRRFNNRIVLREHFRCMPEIIRFSNDLCYLATPLIPLRQYPPNRLEPLVIKYISNGFREGSATRTINKPEAEGIVDAIVQCCNDEKYEDKTMGVIVLQGEAQASLIESLLLEQLGAEEMDRRKIICGNPYSFQGDERHIVFLSMVAAPNERIGAFTKPADQRRFNVAASRAQDQMWLFHSAELKDLSHLCLRKTLLEYFKNPKSQISNALGERADDLIRLAESANRQIERPPEPFDSWFELDVALKIAAKGYRVIPQFPFAGKRIDLVIEGKKSKLAVECDGDYWHGIDEYELDKDRERMLARCGWQFFRIRECSFNANPNTALDYLWYELEKMGITPLTHDSVLEEETVLTNKKELHERNSPLENEVDSELFPHAKSEKAFKNQDVVLLEDIKLENIQQALAIKSSDIRNLIIKVLKDRPNSSCIKDVLPGLILKDLDIISRGKPREEFSRKVHQAVRHLERAKTIETYKSKNVRLRLII